MGDMIVIGLLAICIGLAIRSVWKNHRKGGCCGNCDKCKTCQQ